MTELRRAFIQSQLISADSMIEDFKGLYPRSFLTMMRYVIKSEGGLAPGNHTLFGLDAMAHPDLSAKIQSGRLTIDEALRRYYERYYTQIPGLDDIHPGLRYFIFDSRIQGCTFCVTTFLIGALGLKTSFSSINEGLVRMLKYVPDDTAMRALRYLAANPRPMAERLHQNVNKNARNRGRVEFPFMGSYKRVVDRINHSIKFGSEGGRA